MVVIDLRMPKIMVRNIGLPEITPNLGVIWLNLMLKANLLTEEGLRVFLFISRRELINHVRWAFNKDYQWFHWT